MKKGRAGTKKSKPSTTGKSRIASAKSRIKKVLAKVPKLSFAKPKSTKKKTLTESSLKSKKKKADSPAVLKKVVRARKPSVSRSYARQTGKPQLQPVQHKIEASPASASSTIKDLPFSYHQTKLELLVRDPEWAYAWWDFSGDTWSWMSRLFVEDPATRGTLRVYNLSHQTTYDLDVHFDARNWYLHLGFPDTEFEVELGLLDSRGRFHSIARSNRIRTPRNSPSPVIDPLWDPSAFGGLEQMTGRGGLPSEASLFSSPPFASSPQVRKS